MVAMRVLVGATILLIALPAVNAMTQDRDEEERPITLVGCVMRESQYRDMYGPGLSGPRGAGIGGRNEYMLVDAHEITTGGDSAATNISIAPSPDSKACPPEPGTFPTAYELTGSRERELAPYLGRRVEVTGIRKEANARPVGTSGIARPTGGFDPLGHELHVFEVEVEGVREPTATLAAAPEPAPAPPAPVEQPRAPEPEAPVAAAEPAPAPAPPAPEPAPAPVQEAQVAQDLPRTASPLPLPLAGLAGLLSLAAAAGLRGLRRRE